MAARLRHPGIVTIYDVGYLPQGVPFISMELVAGQSLRELLARERVSFRRGVELLAGAAEAVHAAHQQGLVHRDLKPGNILIDDRGQPRVVDFGLAVHESRQALLNGDVAGTPAYMAPEQVRGEAHRLDGRTDVWSLGVVLYEMLTGRRPFGGRLEQVFDEIQNREPKPPRQIDDRIPKELEEICLKCLSKAVAGRYSTALDVALALRDWMWSSTVARLQPELRQEAAPPATPAISSGNNATGDAPFVKNTSVPVWNRRAVLLRGGFAGLVLLVALGALEFARSSFSNPSSKNDDPRSSSPHGNSVAAIASPGQASPEITPFEAGEKDGREKKARAKDSQPADAPPDGEAGLPTVDDMLPSRWYALLDRRPQELVWPNGTQDSSWNIVIDRQELSVASSFAAAFSMFNCPANDFRLEVRIAKTNWLGNSGLFWGAHEANVADGKPSLCCQALFLHGFLDKGKLQYRLERDFLEFRLPPGARIAATSRFQYLAVALDAPDSAEMQLEVTVVGGAVQNVRWNGRTLPALNDGRPQVVIPRPLISTGMMGVINDGGSAIFRDARIQLLK